MNVGELLRVLHSRKSTTRQRHPDGSSVGDGVTVFLDIEGDGEILGAEVDFIRVHQGTGNIYVQANGEKREEV